MAFYSTQKYLGVTQAGFALSSDVLANSDRVLNSSATELGIDGATINLFLKVINAGNATTSYGALAGYTGGNANGG
jgi:hypothetical protein